MKSISLKLMLAVAGLFLVLALIVHAAGSATQVQRSFNSSIEYTNSNSYLEWVGSVIVTMPSEPASNTCSIYVVNGAVTSLISRATETSGFETLVYVSDRGPLCILTADKLRITCSVTNDAYLIVNNLVGD